MTYSDGVPVTAHNYAYAIKRALSPVVAGNYSNTLYAVTGGQAWREADPAGDTSELEAAVSESIKALDDRTLQITLDYAAGYFPYVMAIWVTYPVREDLVRARTLDWWRRSRQLHRQRPVQGHQSHRWARNGCSSATRPTSAACRGSRRSVFKEIDSSETELLAYQNGEANSTHGAGIVAATADRGRCHPQRRAAAWRGRQHQLVLDEQCGRAVRPDGGAPGDRRRAQSRAVHQPDHDRGGHLPPGTLLYPGNPAYQEDFQQTYDEASAQALLERPGTPGARGSRPSNSSTWPTMPRRSSRRRSSPRT